MKKIKIKPNVNILIIRSLLIIKVITIAIMDVNVTGLKILGFKTCMPLNLYTLIDLIIVLAVIDTPVAIAAPRTP